MAGKASPFNYPLEEINGFPLEPGKELDFKPDLERPARKVQVPLLMDCVYKCYARICRLQGNQCVVECSDMCKSMLDLSLKAWYIRRPDYTRRLPIFGK